MMVHGCNPRGDRGSESWYLGCAINYGRLGAWLEGALVFKALQSLDLNYILKIFKYYLKLFILNT